MTGYDDIDYASLTDVGVRRSHNQDAYAVLLATDPEQWRERGHVFVVADGMGAHAVGELASELAVGIIPHTYLKHAQEGPASALRKAFVEANASIHARGQQNREFEGMGTTSTALILREEGAWIGHVGDSRAYRIRDKSIEQLSFDHSLVWEYARRQRVDPDEVQGIPSNVIIRSLGPEPLVQVDIEGPHPLEPGDVFVLCSDGLSGQLTDHEIGAVASVLPPSEACQFLVDLANMRGGPDNITIVVVRLEGVAAKKAVAAVPPPRRSLLPHLPWPPLALFAGALLAGAAVMFAVNQIPGVVPIFVLAALCIVGGLVGLVVHYSRDQERLQKQEEPRELRVHRRNRCAIDRGFYDKLVKATSLLKERASERNWDVDWTILSRHERMAEELLKRDDLLGAFREYCRAMRPLAETLQRQRNKEESFQPVWDKDRNGGTDRPPRQQEVTGGRVSYRLRYLDAIWQTQPAGSRDPSTDLVLLGIGTSTGQKDQAQAALRVLVLPRQNDLKDATAAALSHVEARYKESFPGTALEPVADENTLSDGPTQIGNVRGQLLKLHIKNSATRERFVLLGVIQQPSHVVALHADCDWQQRALWEREFRHVLNTFQL